MIMMDYAERVATAVTWIARSAHLVAFTGAGISTESGLPDYRGPDGVWTRRDQGLPPKPATKAWTEFEPNRGHLALVKLQDRDILRCLISQNVDNLHLKSGIERELLAELHGNGATIICLQCDGEFLRTEVGWDKKTWGNGYRTDPVRKGQPSCACGGRLISSVVNFGDPLPEKEYDKAEHHSRMADVYLAIGSSLQVTPAANLPAHALKAGAKLILVNQGETPFDEAAHLLFRESAGTVLTDLLKSMG